MSSVLMDRITVVLSVICTTSIATRFTCGDRLE
jgi:hypothetical protein